jgi:2-hydroxycyclohexanecarboxyl-CoA dehydrogenase
VRCAAKKVLVTGAGGAIGAEVCRALLAEGARVVGGDRIDGVMPALASEVNDPDSFQHTVVDVSDTAAVRGVVAASPDPFDGLVNVAGFFAVEDFVDTDLTDWDRMVSANLYTAMAASKAVLPGMLERGRGSIVSFASTAGEYGSIRPSAAYAAAKGAVIAFTKSLAREVAPKGVRVNCVSPGPINTPAFGAGSATDVTTAASRTLIGRMGTPNDLAHACVYLVSDESGYVVGEVLRVNGGSLI